MSATEDRIKESFRRLLAEAKRFHSSHGDENVSNSDYIRFRTEGLNLVRRACGEESDHYRELARIAEDKDSKSNSYYFGHCVGAVEAAERDFEGGLLVDLRRLVSAEVLGDFIEQAETLLEPTTTCRPHP